MTYQTSFADLDYNHKKRLTRREVFLNEMEQTVPWLKLITLIEPAYPTSGRRGRQPMPLAGMLRIHCLQNGFSFSDRQMEDALYEIFKLLVLENFIEKLNKVNESVKISVCTFY